MNYAVVAEFVVQSEAAEYISEAISIIKQWNPKWSPPFFMTDYSEAEQLAISAIFPGSVVYLCNFHREQAWERWVKDSNHNLTKDDANTLLSLLRECAHAPSPKPHEFLPVDHYYNIAVSNLKKSSVWANNKQVSQWLSSKWLSICQVSSLILLTEVMIMTSHQIFYSQLWDLTNQTKFNSNGEVNNLQKKNKCLFNF